jgi:hypothetical protein
MSEDTAKTTCAFTSKRKNGWRTFDALSHPSQRPWQERCPINHTPPERQLSFFSLRQGPAPKRPEWNLRQTEGLRKEASEQPGQCGQHELS